MSPRNTILMDMGVSIATEVRKHRANDAKYQELGWLHVPLVTAWRKVMEAFLQLASQLVTPCYPNMQAQVNSTL